MKANDLTAPGFYWYLGTYPEFDGPTSYAGTLVETKGWVVAKFDPSPNWNDPLSFHDDATNFSRGQLTGEFVGPLEPPA